MPEIDTDTFQVIALALSGLALLVSLIVLSALSKLRKELAERPSGTQASAPARQTAAEPQRYEPQAAAPVATAQSAYEPQAAAPAASKEAEPALAGAAAPAAAEELPVEQPFERDGRWWYKRGDELLVYDEGSGQWEPAPAGSLTGGGVSPPAVDTAYTPVGEASGRESAGTAASGAEGTGFWKCPSCGAVNGATATSCRMCFTAKP